MARTSADVRAGGRLCTSCDPAEPLSAAAARDRRGDRGRSGIAGRGLSRAPCRECDRARGHRGIQELAGGGRLFKMASKIRPIVAAWNGSTPVAISYMTTPHEKMSVRASSSSLEPVPATWADRAQRLAGAGPEGTRRGDRRVGRVGAIESARERPSPTRNRGSSPRPRWSRKCSMA